MSDLSVTVQRDRESRSMPKVPQPSPETSKYGHVSCRGAEGSPMSGGGTLIHAMRSSRSRQDGLGRDGAAVIIIDRQSPVREESRSSHNACLQFHFSMRLFTATRLFTDNIFCITDPFSLSFSS